MSDKIQDGGSAFPRTYSESDLHSKTVVGGHNGISKRDYFAAKAMQAFIVRDNCSYHEIMESSYEFADGMLSESKKEGVDNG